MPAPGVWLHPSNWTKAWQCFWSLPAIAGTQGLAAACQTHCAMKAWQREACRLKPLSAPLTLQEETQNRRFDKSLSSESHPDWIFILFMGEKLVNQEKMCACPTLSSYSNSSMLLSVLEIESAVEAFKMEQKPRVTKRIDRAFPRQHMPETERRKRGSVIQQNQWLQVLSAH